MARRRQRVRSNVSARTGSQPYAGYGLLVDELTRQGLFSERVEVLIVKGSASTNENSVNSVSLDVFYKTFLSLSGVGRLNQTVIAHMLEWISSLNANLNSLRRLNKDNNHSDCLKSFMQFLASKQALQHQGDQKRLLDLLIEKNKLSKKTLDFVLKNGEYASMIAAAYEKIKSSTDTELKSALLFCDRRSVQLAQVIINNNSTEKTQYQTLSDLIGNNDAQNNQLFKIKDKSSLEDAFKLLLDIFNKDQKSFNDKLDEELKCLNSLELQIVLSYIDNKHDFKRVKHKVIKNVKSNLMQLQNFEELYKKNSFFGDWFLFFRSAMANQVFSGCVTIADIENRQKQADYDGSSTQSAQAHKNTSHVRSTTQSVFRAKENNPKPPMAPKRDFRDRGFRR